jgi:ABC-type sugar transport system ATPase subunit
MTAGAILPGGKTEAKATGKVILSVEEVTKDFPGIRALDRVSLDVHAGEVVALLGKNGSGKSTLVKILAGVQAADAGRIRLGGQDQGRSAVEAAAGQMHFVHQDLGLIWTLSAIENLAIGRPLGGTRCLAPLRRRSEHAHVHELVRRFGADLDVRSPVGELTPAQRAIIAIARGMDAWAGGDNLLVLDEPTASLHGREVKTLFTAVRRAAQAGAGVMFISHRLEEVTELADRVVVLRDGRVVADLPAKGLSSDRLAFLITGDGPSATTVKLEHKGAMGGGSSAVPLLRARALAGTSVRGLDLDLWPGEVVGIAGNFGSGREQVAGLLFGSYPGIEGSVEVAGERLAHTPHAAVRRGVALVPADRGAHGGVLSHSVRENVMLPDLRAVYHRGVIFRRRNEKAEVLRWCRQVGLVPLAPERALNTFSGGNQQKAVIARWLRTQPRVLLVDEPTQGVDIAASDTIRRLIVESAHQGVGVLVTSSDNTDLIRMCTRVLVMVDGRVTAELTGDAINDHRLTQESLGLSEVADASQE